MIIGNYKQIDGEYGKGGTSVVYEVERISDQKRFALKHFDFKHKQNYLQEKKVYEVLKQYEKKNKLKLKEFLEYEESFGHINVVSNQKCFCIILELCEKKCLFLMLLEKISENNNFSSDLQKNIMVRVTRALIILKKLNYSHNDIKPENIFLSKNGEFKLGDLGACDKNVSTSQIELLGGTERFQSPQVIEKSGFLGEKQDVFALGITLFMINAQQYPFQKATEFDQDYSCFLQNPQLYWIQKGVNDQQVQNLLTQMMAKEENDRFNLEQVFQDTWLQPIQNALLQ